MIGGASEHLASWEKAVLLARFFTPQDTPAKSLGFSLIEVLVSLFLFSVLALSISASVMNALRADTTSENLTQATILAQDKLEELSAGFDARSGSDIPRPGFTRTWTMAASAPPGGTARAEVHVSWTESQPHTISVATIINE